MPLPCEGFGPSTFALLSLHDVTPARLSNAAPRSRMLFDIRKSPRSTVSERALEAQREDVRGERVHTGIQLRCRLRGKRPLVDAAASARRRHEHPPTVDDEPAEDGQGEP